MNQDQARRMAEEVELPEPAFSITVPLALDTAVTHTATTGVTATMRVTKTGYTEAQVREAIAAALAKLTQGQEPKCWGMPTEDGTICDCITPGEHSREPGKYTVPLFTHPIPSQQEAIDKKDAALRACVEALCMAASFKEGGTVAARNAITKAQEALK